jgi:hypothetical protein
MDYTCNAAERQFLPSFQIPARHFKDPPPPWRTPKELSDYCRHIVADLELGEAPPTSSSFPFAQPIRWCEPKLMPTLVVNTCKTLQVVFC